MSQHKRRHESREYDSDEDISASAPNVDKIISDLARHALFQHSRRDVFHANQIKEVLKERKTSIPMAELMNRAGKLLREQFGLELVELPREDGKELLDATKQTLKQHEMMEMEPSQQQNGEKSKKDKVVVGSKNYAIRLASEVKDERFRLAAVINDSTDKAIIGFLTLVLSIIKLSKSQCIPLFELKKLMFERNIVTPTEYSKHEIFGDIDDLIGLLVKQRYLGTFKEADSKGNPTVFYTIGSRSKKEIKSFELMNFVSETCQKGIPVEEMEEQRALDETVYYGRSYIASLSQ